MTQEDYEANEALRKEYERQEEERRQRKKKRELEWLDKYHEQWEREQRQANSKLYR